MKLIIDIPEEEYNHIKRTNEYSIAHTGYIYDGTPIPDNATNGDVIKAMFPKAYVDENRYETPFIDVTYEGEVKSFSETWWNSPYQKGGKE